MTTHAVTKEFYKLIKTVKQISNNQAVISEWDDEDISRFKVEITPHGGPYNGGRFKFSVTLPACFPAVAPMVRCETPIYHPNIDATEEDDDTTNVCINMFEDETGGWQEDYGVDGMIQGLLFLFHEPNLEDPLSPYFDSESAFDFEENVVRSLKGNVVEGVKYPWNYFGEETDNNNEKEHVMVDINTQKGKADNRDNSLDNDFVGNLTIENAMKNDIPVRVVPVAQEVENRVVLRSNIDKGDNSPPDVAGPPDVEHAPQDDKATCVISEHVNSFAMVPYNDHHLNAKPVDKCQFMSRMFFVIPRRWFALSYENDPSAIRHILSHERGIERPFTFLDYVSVINNFDRGWSVESDSRRKGSHRLAGMFLYLTRLFQKSTVSLQC